MSHSKWNKEPQQNFHVYICAHHEEDPKVLKKTPATLDLFRTGAQWLEDCKIGRILPAEIASDCFLLLSMIYGVVFKVKLRMPQILSI